MLKEHPDPAEAEDFGRQVIIYRSPKVWGAGKRGARRGRRY